MDGAPRLRAHQTGQHLSARPEQHQRHGEVSGAVEQIEGDAAYPPGQGEGPSSGDPVHWGAQRPEAEPEGPGEHCPAKGRLHLPEQHCQHHQHQPHIGIAEVPKAKPPDEDLPSSHRHRRGPGLSSPVPQYRLGQAEKPARYWAARPGPAWSPAAARPTGPGAPAPRAPMGLCLPEAVIAHSKGQFKVVSVGNGGAVSAAVDHFSALGQLPPLLCPLVHGLAVHGQHIEAVGALVVPPPRPQPSGPRPDRPPRSPG